MNEEDVTEYEYWYPLAEIAEILEGEGHKVTYRKLHEWTSKKRRTDFPEPKKFLGRFAFYDIREVREFVVLWNRATRNMKDNVNGRQYHGSR